MDDETIKVEAEVPAPSSRITIQPPKTPHRQWTKNDFKFKPIQTTKISHAQIQKWLRLSFHHFHDLKGHIREALFRAFPEQRTDMSKGLNEISDSVEKQKACLHTISLILPEYQKSFNWPRDSCEGRLDHSKCGNIWVCFKIILLNQNMRLKRQWTLRQARNRGALRSVSDDEFSVDSEDPDHEEVESQIGGHQTNRQQVAICAPAKSKAAAKSRRSMVPRRSQEYEQSVEAPSSLAALLDPEPSNIGRHASRTRLLCLEIRELTFLVARDNQWEEFSNPRPGHYRITTVESLMSQSLDADSTSTLGFESTSLLHWLQKEFDFDQDEEELAILSGQVLRGHRLSSVADISAILQDHRAAGEPNVRLNIVTKIPLIFGKDGRNSEEL